jgi:hypothetical protein
MYAAASGGGDGGTGAAAGLIVNGIVDFFEWIFGGGGHTPSLQNFPFPNQTPTFSVDVWDAASSNSTAPIFIPGLMFFAEGTASAGKQTCPPVPEHPASASVAANTSKAVKIRWSLAIEPIPLLRYNWFYQNVRNKGPWDYKQQGKTLNDFGRLQQSPYQDFGNFNFGATGAAAGIPLQILLRGAGWAQQRAGTSTPQWGHWYDLNGPFGDDPADQGVISAGHAYYQNGCYK